MDEKCWHQRKDRRYVVAERSDDTFGDWFFIQGAFCLDCARKNMHQRAAEGKIVAVFGNNIVDLRNDRYRYFIDNRDKCDWPISKSVGGLINSRETDWF